MIERYRLQQLRGAIVVSVIGSSNPAVCGGLNACGVTGAIDVAARSAHAGDIYVAAAGPARRPYEDFLAALGQIRHGDRAGIHVSGGE